MLVVAGLAVVGLALVVGLLTTGGDEPAVALEDVAGTPAIDGQALPPAASDPAQDPAVGTAAPVVTGAGFDGAPVTIGAPGRPQLIAFMAAWCSHCQEELPEVAAWLAAGHAPEGVDVVAVSTGLDPNRPNWPPDAWFERVGYPGPVLVDDGEGSVAAAYGLTGTPYWVGLDAKGEVVVRVAGRIGVDVLDQLATLVIDG